MNSIHVLFFFFFFNDTATTEIYTLSLHDALPISLSHDSRPSLHRHYEGPCPCRSSWNRRDRKSTRLNSSHVKISYAVFCLKKKNNKFNYDSNTTGYFGTIDSVLAATLPYIARAVI